ncbi:MAG: hypothetical protein ABS939_08315 [Psychrobacillus sp.]
MAKKYITKTTKEYTYNDEGYVIKEVETVEEYEQEIINKATINIGSGHQSGGSITRTSVDKYTYRDNGDYYPSINLNVNDIDPVKIQETLAGLIRNKDKSFPKNKF